MENLRSTFVDCSRGVPKGITRLTLGSHYRKSAAILFFGLLSSACPGEGETTTDEMTSGESATTGRVIGDSSTTTKGIGTEGSSTSGEPMETTTTSGTTEGTSCDTTPLPEITSCDGTWDDPICNQGYCGSCDGVCHCYDGYVNGDIEFCFECDEKKGYVNVGSSDYPVCKRVPPKAPGIEQEPDAGDFFAVFGEEMMLNGPTDSVDNIEFSIDGGEWVDINSMKNSEYIPGEATWYLAETISDEKINILQIACVRAKYFGLFSVKQCIDISRVI